MRRVHLWQLAAGILLLLALAIQFRPTGNDATDAEDSRRPRRGEGNQLADVEAPNRRSERTSATRPVVILSEHQPERIADFVLPLVEGHQVSLRGAIKSLMLAYRDACSRSRTKPLAFEFEFPVENDARISFSMERVNFTDALSRIAGLAGYQEEVINGLAVSFVAIPEDLDLYTRTFRLPPNFAEGLKDELRRLGISHGPSLEELLVAAGTMRPGGQVIFFEDSNTLAATLPIAELDRIASRVSQEAPRQFKTAMTMIQSDVSLGTDLESLGGTEVMELLSSLAEKESAKIITLPSVTSRDQQSAKIEMNHPRADGWTGVVWDLEAERIGLSIVARDSIDYRPDHHPKPYVQDTAYGVFSDGVPQISLIAERDGEFYYRVVTREIIDATGRPVREGAALTGAAVPGKQGFVFSPYNNKVVDVQGIPSGTLVADPSYPASEKRFFRVP